MGLRFRKSVNLGGFRVNMSKSGIGYSYGIKGLRYTKKAGGGTRSTLSLPGTGISYVKDSSGKARKRSESSDENEITSFNSEDIESSSNEFISAMNETTKKNRLYNILRIIAIIGAVVGICVAISYFANEMPLYGIPFIVLTVGCIAACFFLPRVTVSLEIDFSDETLETAYNKLLNGLEKLKSSAGFWEVIGTQSVSDWKNHAGANTLINRKNSKISPDAVSFIKCELALQSIDAQGMHVVFLPNFLAVYQNSSWKAIEYSQVKVEFSESSFIESQTVPADTEILSYTYLHPNKSGGPDKRYSYNPQIPNCAYAEMKLSSVNGLTLLLMSSNRIKANAFCDSAKRYIGLFVS